MELKYKVALTSVWWNDDYKDVRRFFSLSERNKYFKIPEIFKDKTSFNFDIKNLRTPRIVFKEPNLSTFDALNANYLIIEDSTQETKKYYFYFIDNIRQDVADQYIADCKLDVWQTSFLDIDIGSGMIERAHLNRFKKVGSVYVFNFFEDSPLLITEQIAGTYDKLLKAELPLVPSDLPNNVKDWFEEHVLAWAYIFIDNRAARKFYSRDPENNTYSEIETVPPDTLYLKKQVSERYSTFCIPIYKDSPETLLDYNIAVEYTETKNGVNYTKSANLGISALDSFIQNNNGYSYIHNIVISSVNPLTNFLKDSKLTFEISGRTLYVRNTHNPSSVNNGIYYIEEWNPNAYIMYTGIIEPSGAALLGIRNADFIQKQKLMPWGNLSNKLYGLEKSIFQKNEIKNAAKSIILEPKLRQQAYISINLDIFHIVEKELNLIQYSATELRLESYISLSLSNNEYKIRPINQNLGIDNNDFALSISSDLSIPIINTQLESYIANNKSWARIGYIDSNSETSEEYYWQTAAHGIFSQLNARSLLNPGGLINAALSSTVQADMAKHKPGDLKAAPASIKSAVSDAFRIGFEDQIKAYARYFEVPYTVLEKDADYYYYFGYRYGFYKKFTEVFNDSTRRKYFNFIQGQFLAISGSISDEIRRTFTGIFLAGVRMWEVDKPDFDGNLDNYENYLDED